ncbi:MAG TPA: type II secretion system F family protein [Candidatus Saccharimonadales bacterium]|nr:type II secretion system F family protein [Candidatus Saccharimonadales bacterium]
MQFTYKALNIDGKTVTGTAEATSKQALLALLRRQGVRPMLIEPKKEKKWFSSLFGPSKKIKSSDLVIFTRQLSTMVSAGVPLARSLAALQSDAASPYMRQVLAGVTKDVESGLPLGAAFAKYPTVFSDVYVNMVKAGEEGGILDKILKRLALQVELDASIRKKIRSAMMYPMVILTITIVAFFGIMLFIVPKLGKLLTGLGGPNAKLPVYTQVLLSISNFCSRPTILAHTHLPLISKTPNLILLLILAAIGAVYLGRYIRTPKGRYRFDDLMLRLPVIKVIVLKTAIARFARTFAALMGAGVSVLDSLDVTGAAIGNKVIEEELRAAAKEVQSGKQLSEPLGRSKHFPPIVAQMLMVGEETGQIDTVLVKIADFYEEEVQVLIDGMAAIIEPVMIIFLGAGVGLIAASVMGPIANLSKNIGN